jgi:integrase
MAMLELLRGMVGNGFTVHGFRSAFTDWAHDSTPFPKTVVDMALAHTVSDKVEAAYRRGELMTNRSKLMAAWGAHCIRPRIEGENVTPLRVSN